MDAGLKSDEDWEEWGQRDPYYAVLTDPRFRKGAIDAEARRAFFDSGDAHVRHVLDVCARIAGVPAVKPRRVLDFGCGVGRVSIPFARIATEVVGADVSPAMLDEARRNCEESGCPNVTLVRSDDQLSGIEGFFDLVHTYIVLQHVPVSRGRGIVERLASMVGPTGFGALHVTFAWTRYAARYGQPPQLAPPERRRAPLGWPWSVFSNRSGRGEATTRGGDARSRSASDPYMGMYYYNLSELMFILNGLGVRNVTVEIENHDGALGAFLFFRREAND